MFQGKYAVWNWSDWSPAPSSCGLSVPRRTTKWPFELEQLEKENCCKEEKARKLYSAEEPLGMASKAFPGPFCTLAGITKQHAGWGRESWHRKAWGLETVLLLGVEFRRNIKMSPRFPSLWVPVTRHVLKFLLYAWPHPTVCSKVPERI